MQRFLKLKTIPILLGVLIGAAGTQANAATFTVSKLADTNDGTCNADCSLREAIIAANSAPGADTIDAAGVTGTIDLSAALPDIISDINLQGPGAALLNVHRNSASATPLFRIFTIPGGFTVTIAKLTISNGSVSGAGFGTAFGGAISSDGTLTLTGCTLTGNSATGDAGTAGATGGDGQGGAIFNSNNLYVTGCTFSDNSATGGNGATGNGGGGLGGAIYSVGDGITVGTSTFTDNTAKGGNGASGGVSQGGAIRIDGNLALTGCTLTGNSATGGSKADGQGGGLYCSNGFVTVTSCEITNNAAHGTDGGVGQGGGIRSSTNVTLAKSTLSGNSATGGNSNNQGGSASGGGIYNSDTLKINSSTLSANSATGGSSGNVQGGAGLGGGIYNSNVATVSLTNSTLSENTTQGGTSGASAGVARGGGLFLQSGTVAGSGGTATLVSDTIAGNVAGDGSGITISGGTLGLNNTIVALNVGSPNPDVKGAVNASGRFNLIGNGSGLVGITNGAGGNQIGTAATPIDPQIGALQDNGGPTQTRGLLPGSPAIDQGKGFTLVDQRGQVRPFDYSTIANAAGGDGSDIGAFEAQRILISVATARTVNEGSANAPGATNFIITLSSPSNLPTTVNYATADGTATAGADYVEKHGKITFAPGETSKSISVRFVGDDVYEPNEYFYLGITNPVNAGIDDPRGSATIRNDDVATAPSAFQDEPSQ